MSCLPQKVSELESQIGVYLCMESNILTPTTSLVYDIKKSKPTTETIVQRVFFLISLSAPLFILLVVERVKLFFRQLTSNSSKSQYLKRHIFPK